MEKLVGHLLQFQLGLLSTLSPASHAFICMSLEYLWAVQSITDAALCLYRKVSDVQSESAYCKSFIDFLLLTYEKYFFFFFTLTILLIRKCFVFFFFFISSFVFKIWL